LSMPLRRRALVALSTIVLWAVALPAATTAETVRSDITNSAAGRAISSAAKERFRAYGPGFGDESTRVFRLEDGSAVVVPDGYDIDSIDLRRDGSIRLTTGADTTADRTSAVVAAAASWSLRSNRCFARTTIKTPNGNSGGFMDTCYEIYKLSGETDTGSDYWNITTWATVDATRANTFGDYAWIHVDRDGGGTWQWADWSPRTDLNDNCGSRTLSISALGFGLGFGTTVCETWLLTKYAAAGTLKVQWNGDSTGAREVALMSAIKNTPGVTPIWGISWNSVLKCRPGFAC